MSRNPVAIYVDGAFRADAKYGAWGFFVPVYAYEAASSCAGNDSGRFELLAAVRGVQWVMANHASPAPIEVRTDCMAVIHWVLEIRMRLNGASSRKSFPPHHADVLIELQKAMAKRPVFTSKVKSRSDAGNERCHKIATETLALAMHSKPEVKAQLAATHGDNKGELARAIRARQIQAERLDNLDDHICRLIDGRANKFKRRYLRWRHWRWVLLYSWRRWR